MPKLEEALNSSFKFVFDREALKKEKSENKIKEESNPINGNSANDLSIKHGLLPMKEGFSLHKGDIIDVYDGKTKVYSCIAVSHWLIFKDTTIFGSDMRNGFNLATPNACFVYNKPNRTVKIVKKWYTRE